MEIPRPCAQPYLNILFLTPPSRYSLSSYFVPPQVLLSRSNKTPGSILTACFWTLVHKSAYILCLNLINRILTCCQDLCQTLALSFLSSTSYPGISPIRLSSWRNTLVNHIIKHPLACMLLPLGPPYGPFLCHTGMLL